MMWGYGLNWPGMALMMFGSIFWIVVLVVLAWVMLRWLKHRTILPPQQIQTLPGSGPNAIEILSQRYARGEIDATTFEQMRERLQPVEITHQRSSEEVHRPAGERLFDGSTSGVEI